MQITFHFFYLIYAKLSYEQQIQNMQTYCAIQMCNMMSIKCVCGSFLIQDRQIKPHQHHFDY